MFGTSAFAQTTFAALPTGGQAYTFSIIEYSGLAD